MFEDKQKNLEEYDALLAKRDKLRRANVSDSPFEEIPDYFDYTDFEIHDCGYCNDEPIDDDMMLAEQQVTISSDQEVVSEPTVDEEFNAHNMRFFGKDIDLNKYSAAYYSSVTPPQHNWLLEDSFMKNSLGVIVAPPGCGKGMFALLMANCSVENISLLDYWKPQAVDKVIYVSAEDDSITLHNRMRTIAKELNVVPKNNIYAIPVEGEVALFKDSGVGNSVVPSDNFHSLEALIKEIGAKLIFIDTVACFFPIAETDNPKMSSACNLLNSLCKKYECNIVLIHHTDKIAGSLAGNSTEVSKALDHTRARGFSSLSASVRWQLNMVPLAKSYASSQFEDASSEPDGMYVALRVSKKNAGRPEDTIFAKKSENGVLHRVYKKGSMKEISPEKELELFDDFIKNFLSKGSKSVTNVINSCTQEVKIERLKSTQLVEDFIKQGILEKVKNPEGRKGNHLKYIGNFQP